MVRGSFLVVCDVSSWFMMFRHGSPWFVMVPHGSHRGL